VEKEIAFVDVPDGIELSTSSDLPELQFKIKGKGVYLHLYNLFNGSIEINFEQMLESTDTDLYRYRLIDERLNLPYGLNVINLYTQEIDLSENVLVDKLVPLELKTEVIYSENFVKRDSIGFTPDSVRLKGVYKNLKPVKAVILKEEPILIAQAETKIDYPLSEEFENLEVSPENVTYSIFADEVVTGQIMLAVDTPSSAESEKLSKIPDSILVEYRVISRLKDSIKHSDFKLDLRLKEENDQLPYTRVDVVLLHKALQAYTIKSKVE
jgi:hypothetical protein